MNQLTKQSQINESALNREHYFQALFQEACRNGLLNDIQIERIQLELIELLGKEVERYTNGESTSVPMEKAQELLQSVTYCLGHYLKTIDSMDEKLELLKSEKIQTLFHRGMDTVSDLKAQAAALLKNIQKNRLNINNYAYQDTIQTGLPEFFHDYNIEYGAHDMPGSIDYPLLKTITDLIGVEIAYEYLYFMTLENDFLRHFSEESINKLLAGFDKASEHMLINLFELVLTNALGCELSGLDILKLNIETEDRIWLQNHLEKYKTEELQEKLKDALNQIAEKLKLETEILSYAKKAIPELAVRLKNNLEAGSLNRIFIAFSNSAPQEEFLEDGSEMEDSRLREIVEELNSMKSIREKVAKIRETVHNMNDFMELLEECFYGREYSTVLRLLSNTERAELKRRILQEAGPEGTEDYIPEKEWQQILFKIQEE